MNTLAGGRPGENATKEIGEMVIWKTVLASLAIGMAATFAATAVAQDASQDKQGEREEAKTVTVKMVTSKGDIVIALNQEKAPISVENFIMYAEKGHYEGTIFHRVIPGFMIQGGGMNADMQPRETEDPIKNEWRNGLSNKRGSIAMARLGNQPDSATSQFFINVSDNAFLDQPRDGAGYAVFGEVVEGMDVVDAIVAVPTATKPPHANVPQEPITIEKVEVVSWE
ncbi:MAG: peptidylprolyl isomerase [Planctomycetota bacterium]|nr:peptidylprolyl isomerase [Planctomycetota bacterium]